MSWEHAIARELKKRDNPVYYAWFSGEVTSPVQITDEEGQCELLWSDDCFLLRWGSPAPGRPAPAAPPGPSLTTRTAGCPAGASLCQRAGQSENFDFRSGHGCYLIRRKNNAKR